MTQLSLPSILAPSPEPLSLGTPPSPTPAATAISTPTPPPTPVLGPPAGSRTFDDVLATRKAIFDRTLAAARAAKPLVNQRHTLRLVDVDYADQDEPTIQQQKQAILRGESLGRRLRGTWQLIDNVTGDVVDTKKQVLARVPYLTDRGTFINNGTEYGLGSQQRLRAGIFARLKSNGEIESHANLLPGKGFSHRYYLDPAKGTFHMNLEQAKIPLMPLMRALGATDQQLREAWGDEIFAANYGKDDEASLDKLYEKVTRKPGRPVGRLAKQEELRQLFEAMEVDPEVTTRTLGKAHKHLNAATLLDSTRKLLQIARGEADVDDRDALAYQNFYGPEDLFAERIEKDAGGARRALLWKNSFQNSLKRMPANPLQGQLMGALLSSGLGQALEEINPGELLDKRYRVTRMGEGGIGSVDAIPEEARDVQPSQMGFVDPVRTPESMRVGVDLFFASDTRKGNDGRVYSRFRDPKNGQEVWKSPQDVADMTIAFAGELKRPSKYVRALQDGRIRYVGRDKIDLEQPHFERSFSSIANMVPFKSAMKAQRMAMAGRMLTQALPLRRPEAPLVQTGVPGETDSSFEQRHGSHFGAVRAESAGRVASVDQDGITVQHQDGTTRTYSLYRNFPFNRKTFMHNTPRVQVGDQVSPNSLLASSNFTDNEGTAALGLNARVAYLDYKGLNFEDASVISESMADRLTSSHMYQHDFDWSGDETRKGRDAYTSLFPKRFDRKTLDTIDDNGVVKVGTEIKFGDPLILAARSRSRAQNRIHRKGERGFLDSAVTWEHHDPGIVTDVEIGKNGPVVVVQSQSKMQIGDKLSGRMGDKGVISAIIPDEQMPRDSQGRPFEILLSPLGIISRANPNQTVEAALGKIAELTGKPYRIPDFEDIEDLQDFAEKELQKYGLSDIEDVTDPDLERKIPGVYTGNRFFMKLHHTAESKEQGRGSGAYTMDDTPAQGSKRVGMLDTNAMLSAGGTQYLRDAGLIRGQRSEDYDVQYMRGYTPVTPKVPFTWEKFVNHLKASGVNVIPQGHQTHVLAMTDPVIQEMAGDREITSGNTVNFDEDLTPHEGGLFDPQLTGGHGGRRWSKITLPEPMPNPVMEEPIRRLLGLTEQGLLDVIAGRKTINTGTGPKAIQEALKGINVSREIAAARENIKHGSRARRDDAIRKLKFLKGAEKDGIHPSQWMVNAVPVLPPIFRPVSLMSGSSVPLVSDANYLYKELLSAKDNLVELGKAVGDDVGDERLAMYSAHKAVVGLGDPVHPKLQQKGVKGILKTVFGSSPKYGTVQRRLLGVTVDQVGRAVVRPNPELDMDSLGIPEQSAWEIYDKHIIRRLHRKGMPMHQAMEHLENRSDLARQALMTEMGERPVVMSRAPVLHKFGIMAFRPRLATGSVVEVSPLVVGGFGMDFDGDAVQFSVPQDPSAVREAMERLMPSKSLLSPGDFKSPVHKPTQGYAGGLYDASLPAKKGSRERVFATRRDAVAAWKRGEIDANTPINILSE